MKTPGGITGKGFVKGDQRCNRKGRPNGFDELRRVAQQIMGEDAIWADGSVITRAELILRRWSRSKNPKQQMLFMEIAFGPCSADQSRGEELATWNRAAPAFPA